MWVLTVKTMAEPIKPHNSGKIVKPVGPKPGITKQEKPKRPEEMDTVILHAEDLEKNELVDKMLAAQAGTPAHEPEKGQKQSSGRIPLPTESYHAPPNPVKFAKPADPRQATPVPMQGSKRIPLANPFIAQLEDIYKLYETVAPQLAVLAVKKNPDWELVLPEEIRKSDLFKDTLKSLLDKMEGFYSHTKKLLTDTSYYTTMQANAEKMQQKASAALEQLAAKEAAIKAREAQAATNAGVTPSGYQRQVADIEEERIALAQERADIASKFTEQKRLAEKLEAEKDEFEREKKKFYTDREADTKTLTDLQGATERLGQRENAVKAIETQVNKQMEQLKTERKALDDMIAAYQRDEEALRVREDELKEYNRQSEAIRASNESAGTALDNARKGYERKEQELDKRASDLDLVTQKVLADNKALEERTQLYEQQKAELDTARAAYDKDRAALDELAEDLKGRNETLARGYKDLEEQQRMVANREKRLGEDIEKVVVQRVADVHKLVHEVLSANQDYVSTMRSGGDELLRKMADFAGSVTNIRNCYALEDEKRRKIYDAAVKKLNELTGRK
jgi:chromosome segregation ATPase